jgi:succinoglycan biosynthesis protein ExoA
MLVSVIIPASRWDAHLERALDSVAAQRLPDDVSVEVAVALGEVEGAGPRPGVIVVANPGGSIPVGLNLAARATSGEVLARVDSRCRLPTDYLARVVAALSDPGVGSVGGAALVVDRGVMGSAYAVAFNSPLLGPSRYRFSRTSGPTDSSYLGAWRRATFEALDGFDERLPRNQDNDLAERVRASGLEVRYDADAVVGYVAGRSLPGTVRHHYSFGWWRMAQRRQGGRGFTARHAVAVTIVAAAGASGLVAVSRPRTRGAAVALGIAGYLGAVGASWATAARLRATRPDLDLAPLHPLGVVAAPALAAVLDAGWALGLLRGRRAAGHRPPVEDRGGLRADPG